LVRETLTFLLGSIALLIICSLLLALSNVFPAISSATVVAFVLAMLSMLTAVMLALFELRMSMKALELERNFVEEHTAIGNDPLTQAGNAGVTARGTTSIL
jgi:hypothetical protein